WGLVGGLVMPTVIARAPGLPWIVGGFGLLTASGYLGLLLAPSVSPLLWSCVLGIGGFAFPSAIALLPARTRSPLVTARPSGMVQPIRYLLAPVGACAAGLLLGAAGSSAWVVRLLPGTGLLLAVAGCRGGLPGRGGDEISRWPRPGTAPGGAGSRGRAGRSVGGCPHEPRPHP